jgi:hypothetical protein
MRSLAFGFKDVIFRYKKEKEFIDVLKGKGGVGSGRQTVLKTVARETGLQVRILSPPLKLSHGVMVTTSGFGPEVPSSSLGGTTYIPL